MKKHAIIPIFIPHEGCGHECIFCNQHIITARQAAPSCSDVCRIIDDHLNTLRGRGLEVIEIAFFGGSFTGIPIESQRAYLDIANGYKQSGIVQKIHLSTRPDYIDRQILDMLKEHGADTIELGCQSFNDEVLLACRRGHTAKDIYKACELIKSYGFELGIQLMIGLPKDNKETAIDSAKKAAALRPDLARLYPTVVLPGTELARQIKTGAYTPLSENEAVDITKEMYKILMHAGITIMRVGLKSTDLMTNEADMGHGYHPAFRQLVEGEIAKEQMLDHINRIMDQSRHTHDADIYDHPLITFSANQKWFSPMIGHKRSNKKYMAETYPNISFNYSIDNSLPDGQIISANSLNSVSEPVCVRLC